MVPLIIITMMMSTKSDILFDFEVDKSFKSWRIVDDVVMGGRSDGHFTISDDGTGVFSGRVSLENNGGFSSLRYNPGSVDVSAYTKIQLFVRGDGKRYQFRTKTNAYDRHAYIQYFETNGSWQKVTIEMDDMYPTFRGRQLDMANYPGKQLSELAFLIANKKNEAFKLEIKSINLLE